MSSNPPFTVSKQCSPMLSRCITSCPVSSRSTVSMSLWVRGTCLSSPAAHVRHVTRISVTMMVMVYSLILWGSSSDWILSPGHSLIHNSDLRDSLEWVKNKDTSVSARIYASLHSRRLTIGWKRLLTLSPMMLLIPYICKQFVYTCMSLKSEVCPRWRGEKRGEGPSDEALKRPSAAFYKLGATFVCWGYKTVRDYSMLPCKIVTSE